MNFLEYFYNHLEKVIKSTKVLYYQPTQLIFLLVIKDYLEGEIDSNFVASAAAQLYYQLNKPSLFDNNFVAQELGNILSEVSELDYFDKKDKKKFKIASQKLKDYFDKYKELLNK